LARIAEVTRPQLVLVPGLLCDAAVFAPQSRALEPHANLQIADHGELASLPAMAERILAAVSGSFAIAGHSMGGRVAMEVLRRAPERVTGVALLDTAYQALPSSEEGERERAARQLLLGIAQRRGMEAMARNWLRGMVYPARADDAGLIHVIVAMIVRRTPSVYAAQIKALLERPDATEVLRAVRCPALVLCGHDDSWSTPARHHEMHALIAGSELTEISECGHMCTLERPEAVSVALRRWIDRL
jgi:pimeloyl-ACP methyl ester carboxylesterase